MSLAQVPIARAPGCGRKDHSSSCQRVGLTARVVGLTLSCCACAAQQILFPLTGRDYSRRAAFEAALLARCSVFMNQA